MSYDDIIAEIAGGLSGESDADIKYLTKQMERYKEHDMSKEISRACGRMIYELLPDDKKKDMAKLLGQMHIGVRQTIEEARFCCYKKNFHQAKCLLEGIIEKYEQGYFTYSDDAVSEYHTFYEPFEEILYKNYSETEKDLRAATEPFSVLYSDYGNVLFELKQYENARAALEKALRWNPASAQIRFEYAEVFKSYGDMSSFLQETIQAHKYSFKRPDLARCYRNYGYFFVEAEEYDEAVAALHLSNDYEVENRMAQSELYYISQKTGNADLSMPIEKIISLMDNKRIVVGAYTDVVGLAYSLGKVMFEQKRYANASYFLSIAYGITHSDEIAEMLGKLPTS